MSCYVQNSEGDDTSESLMNWQTGSLGSISIRTSTKISTSKLVETLKKCIRSPQNQYNNFVKLTHIHGHTHNNKNTLASIHTL